jgi:hypothetical protein
MNPATAEIATELDNRAYTPGETLRGTVRWRMDAAATDGASLRLIYHTAGKGTTDVLVVEERKFDSPTGGGEGAFEFVLPDGPYSFSGKLVSLIWSLEFEAGVGKDALVERMDLTLSPTGKEIDLYAHATAEMPQWSGLSASPWKRA